jgi:hypothetical protein
MSITIPLKWVNGVVSQLDTLVPTPASVQVLDYSQTTDVLVGSCNNGGYDQAVMWSGTSITALPEAVPGIPSVALQISRDGSTIVGLANNSGSWSDLSLCIWTSNGTVATLLTPTPVFPPTRVDPFRLVSLDYGARMISSDGAYVLGKTGDQFHASPELAAVWHNTSQSSLSFFSTFNYQTVAPCMSDAGTKVFGTSENSSGGAAGVMWTNGTPQRLANANTSPLLYFCTPDGTVVYGYMSDNTGTHIFYWDSLSTDNGNGTIGTYHRLDNYPGSTNVPVPYQATVVTGQPIAAGAAQDSDGVYQAGKWTGTTLTVLPSLGFSAAFFSPGTFAAMAYGLSSDASIVCGAATDSSNNRQPVWWDSSNVLHTLPLPALDGYTSGDSQTYGISSNGTVMWGYANYDALPPPPPPFPDPNKWTITSKFASPSAGGIGEFWMDQQYIDFSDLTTRRMFINGDKTWVYLGYYGELPLGGSTYPLVWNVVQAGNDPTDFLYGYGQNGGAYGWDEVSVGDDPTTGNPYPAMSFDDCADTQPSLVGWPRIVIYS